MPNYIGPDAHRCPICDKRFESKRALFSHMAHTQAHDGMLEEIWRLRFLLAEAERDKEIYRKQRDEWRAHSKEMSRSYIKDHALRIKADELTHGLADAVAAGWRLGTTARELLEENTSLKLATVWPEVTKEEVELIDKLVVSEFATGDWVTVEGEP